MAGGCTEIEERIYAHIENELRLSDVTDPRIYERTKGRYIYLHPRGKEMIEYLCGTLNRVSLNDTFDMAGLPAFFQQDSVEDNFLKFIIMYIWDALHESIFDFRDRDERLKYLRDVITNPIVLRAIEKMNDRYTKGVLDNPKFKDF